MTSSCFLIQALSYVALCIPNYVCAANAPDTISEDTMGHTTSAVDEDSHRFSPDLDEVDCPNVMEQQSNANLFFSSIQVPLGIPYRSHRTLPKGWVRLAPSRIPEAGLGVFADTFIPAHTWLGEFDGEVITKEETSELSSLEFSYMWEIKKNGSLLFYISAFNDCVSNWLRYPNCPTHKSQENIQAKFCYGKVFYVTSRDIAPGQELLLYYGDGYATELGIDVNHYYSS